MTMMESNKVPRNRRATTESDTASTSAAQQRMDDHEKKVQRKLAEENNATRRRVTDGVDADAAKLKIKFEKERSRDHALARVAASSSSNGNGNDAANVAFEERLRRKLSGEESGGGGRSGSGNGNNRSSNRPKGLSSSMPIGSASAADADRAFEEKLRRKLARGNGGSTSASNGSSNDRIRRVNNNIGQMRSSMPETTMSNENKHAILEGYEMEDVVPEEDVTASEKETSATKASGHFLPDPNKHVDDAGANKPPRAKQHIKQEDYFNVSNIDLEDVLQNLQACKVQNNESLVVPASHPAFLNFLDALSSLGVEDLLKKRWDYQLAGVRSFRREHGDCFVRASHPTLGEWTRVQRRHYLLYEERLPCALNKKRFGKLKNVKGFEDFVRWKEEEEEEEEKEADENDRVAAEIEVVSSRKEQRDSSDDEVKATKSKPSEHENERNDIVSQEKPNSFLEQKLQTMNIEIMRKMGTDISSESERRPHNTPLDQNNNIPTMNTKTMRKMGSDVSSEREEKSHSSGGKISDRSDEKKQSSKPQMRKARRTKKLTSLTAEDQAISTELDQKLESRNMKNKVKFMERGIKAHRSSRKEEGQRRKSKRPDKEAIAAELHSKRMLRRSVRSGLGRYQSRRVIVEALAEEEVAEEEKSVCKNDTDNDEDGQCNEREGEGSTSQQYQPTLLRRYANLMRSCSASNLCPGSWECPDCSHINEPVGLNECAFCRMCNTLKPNDLHNNNHRGRNESWGDTSKPTSNEASFKLNRHTSKDDLDLNIDSWSELGAVLAVAATQSVADLALQQASRQMPRR